LGGNLVFSTEANALFAKWDSLGVSASTSYKVVANNVINQLISSGVWANLDCFYVFCFHNRTACLVDWKNPNTRTATATGAYGGDWTANLGFKGNGTSFYIDTAFNPFDGGTYNFGLNNNSCGVYIASCNNNVGTQAILSARSAGDAGMSITTNGNSVTGSNNNSTSSAMPQFSHIGLISNTRTASNAYHHTKDGNDDYYIGGTGYGTAATTVSVNRSFKLLAKDLNGTYSTYSTESISYMYAGSSSVDKVALSNIMYQYCFAGLSMIIANKTKITFVGDSFTTYGTYQPRTVLGLTNTVNYVIHNRSQNGYNTSQLYTDSLTNVFPFNQSYFVGKNIIFLQEMINSMTQYNSNVASVVGDIITYCNYARGLGFKVIVTTMVSHLETASFINANRQNPADLYDDATVNGYIRNHYTEFSDGLADWGSDALMGVYSNGVPGVGEKNTTYFQVDEIHPTTAGFNRLADNYVIAAINSLL